VEGGEGVGSGGEEAIIESDNVPSHSKNNKKNSNKNTQLDATIVKFIALSYRHCSTCFGHYYAHHQEPVKLPLQPLVSV